MTTNQKRSSVAAFVTAALLACGGYGSTATADDSFEPQDHGGRSDWRRDGRDLREIQTVVVIYAENRSFDNLFGMYPGANGLRHAPPWSITQLDRDGSVLSGLPAVWGGTSSGVTAGGWPGSPTDSGSGSSRIPVSFST